MARPPSTALSAAEFDVVGDEGQLPHGQVSLHCRRPDCESVFHLPLDVPLNGLGLAAHMEGWSRHPGVGPVCGKHPYGTPIAELDADEEAANRSRQVSIETIEFTPIDAAEE